MASSSDTKPLPAGRAGSSRSALTNALVIASALGIGLWALVDRGQIAWPPGRMLSAITTLAGYLALAGPIVLARRDRGGAGVGDLVWMTAGLLIWFYNAAALIRGTFETTRVADPVGPIGLALAVLAVSAAAWRLHGPGRVWTWTNVTGWILGIFWVGSGLAALLPSGVWPLGR